MSKLPLLSGKAVIKKLEKCGYFSYTAERQSCKVKA